MYISLDWLRDFVEFDIVDKSALDKVVVGHVKQLLKHPDADGLKLAQIDLGDETVQIVCGGVNLAEGRYVPVAQVGAVLPGNWEIKKGKIRGEESHGMICAKEEIGMGIGGAREIWLLDESRKWTPGMPLLEALGLNNGLSPQEMGDLITNHTAEVEGVREMDEYLHNVVTGKLLEHSPIEGSDKLSKATFDIGWKQVQVIFGRVHEVAVNDILPIALPGAKLPGGEIHVREMMGVKTEGMIADDSELGIENTRGGLTRFPAETPLGLPVAPLLRLNTRCLDIDNKSLTHRPDLWGHYGFAREVATILNKKLQPLDNLLYEGKGGAEATMNVDILDSEVCPRFSACIMTGIKVKESPQWLKARIQEGGMSPINNIVDITNYVMMELGQPMHAYDRTTVGSDELHVGLGDPKKKLVTLDGDEHELHAEDPVIYNAEGEPLILAGIKGGLKSGITDDTSEIILEAANWHPIMIRKASTRHALRTDASQRFEKGLNPSMTELALRRAIKLIQEVCPDAKLASPINTTGKWTAEVLSLNVSPESINNKIGIEVPREDMLRILSALEFEVKDKGEYFEVTVPLHRMTGDVDIEEDIVEEIARIYGYEKIPALLPDLPIRVPRENAERAHKHTARRIMADMLGFTELFNYSFYGKELMEKCGLEEEGHVKVLNYLSEDQTHMRKSMTVNMLAKIAANAREFNEMKVFEIGRSYKEVGEFMPQEDKKLIAAVASKAKTEVFYTAKGMLQSFLRQFRMGKVELKPSQEMPPYAHPKKCVDVIIRGQKVGVVFSLHPAVAKNFDLEHQVGIFALNFNMLVSRGRDLANFTEPPRFPGMNFDVSVLANQKCTVGELEKAIRSTDKNRLIENLSLFDIYEGKNIPEGKRSLSFNIALRHPERTLTDEEFHQAQEAVFTALEKAGGEVRGR